MYSQQSWVSHVDPRNALRALKAAAKRAKLPSTVGLHTLRHSAGSVMLSAGVPLKVVSEVFGHASVAITGDV
ncbi:MAG: tyrosine-type recombinase/integrase [Propionibacteriaceae bacterium]